MKSKEIEIKFPKDFYINKNGLIVSEITLEELNKIIDYIDECQRINLDLANRIDKAIKYCEESSKTIKSEYFSDVLKILRGDE